MMYTFSAPQSVTSVWTASNDLFMTRERINIKPHTTARTERLVYFAQVYCIPFHSRCLQIVVRKHRRIFSTRPMVLGCRLSSTNDTSKINSPHLTVQYNVTLSALVIASCGRASMFVVSHENNASARDNLHNDRFGNYRIGAMLTRTRSFWKIILKNN